MKKNIAALILAAGATIPAVTMAAGTDPGFYVGGGYSFTTLDSNDVDADADLGVLFVRGGYQLNQYVALEARLGEGVQDDKIDGVKIENDEFYGAYVKVGLPTTTGFYPYGLLGMTHAKIKLSVPGFSDSTSDSDVSYGVGVDYWFSKQLSGGLEYANFYDKDGDSITGVTLGVNYKF
jgi:opacity protein-like surface antigen